MGKCNYCSVAHFRNCDAKRTKGTLGSCTTLYKGNPSHSGCCRPQCFKYLSKHTIFCLGSFPTGERPGFISLRARKISENLCRRFLLEYTRSLIAAPTTAFGNHRRIRRPRRRRSSGRRESLNLRPRTDSEGKLVRLWLRWPIRKSEFSVHLSDRVAKSAKISIVYFHRLF